MKYFAALALLCSVALQAAASNEPLDTIIGQVHHIQEVQVVSRHVEKNITSGTPTQFISADDLQKIGISNFSDAVKKFAGANVRDYGGIGGMKTVSVRNLGAQHTAVSYDGITVSNTQAGQIDIGRFSLDNVKMLSLSIGQNDDIMQTARHFASAGVLDIETRKPYFGDNQDYSIRLKVRGGSFGLVNPSLRYWQRLGKRLTMSVDGTCLRADGVYPFTLKNGMLKTHEKRYNSDIKSWNGEANFYYTFNDSSQLDTKIYYYYSQRGLPGVVVLYNSDANERLWDENFFAQSSYKKRLSDKWELRAHLKYDHSWNRYEDVNVKYTDNKQIDVDRQDEYYGSATIGWHPIHNLSISLAQDLAVNSLRNNINLSPNPLRFSSLTAMSAQLQLGRLALNGNLVNTYITESVSNGDKPDDRKRLSPSLSLSYRLLKDEALYVRTSYKSTFRVPTFNDLYYLRMGNTGLRPEKAREYGMGLTWSMRPFRCLYNFTVTVDGYYNDVTDKIVAFPSTYIWKMANFGKVHIHGLDATLATCIRISRVISIDMAMAYTLQKAVDLTDESSAYYKSQLPYTPENSGNVSFIINNPIINVGYSLMGCGKRYSSVMNTDQYKLDSYFEHSVTLSHEFKFKSYSLSLNGVVHNITNKQYEIIKYYPMPGRNWEITGIFTF
ncbi:MAG: TonB-dependent receptor plug domain-containing protein [Prevotella sp.]|nr:TonB-dependent receptor plug domain-containing protein [Prevotella sp.]